MAESPPFCSVIIVTYNGRDLLRPCLSAALAQRYSPYEIILVDNASADGSAEMVAAEFPSVRVIRAARNLGFAGGNNEGVRHARGALIALLNNDAVPEPEWLRSLVDAVTRPGVAVAGSSIRTEGIPERYYERNGSVNFLCHNIMRKFARPEETFFAGGAALIFRRDILGIPFDEDYFLYIEDVYLSMRARFMGYDVVQSPASRVHHRGSSSTRREPSALMTMYQERNRLLTIALFFSPMTLVRIAPLVAANVAAKIAAACAGRRYAPAGLLRAYGWMLLHPGSVVRKRKALRAERRVEDAAVTSWMTADLTNGESPGGHFLNSVARLYCRMAGLSTLELRSGLAEFELGPGGGG